MSVSSLLRSDLLRRGAPYLSLMGATLLSILVIKKFSAPYSPIAMLWFAACVVNAGLVKVPWARLLWLNAASAWVLFGLAEGYFYFQRVRVPVAQEGTMRGSLMRSDDVLGYAPKAGAVVTDRRRRDGELMWDVVYTIDDHGLRVTPKPDNPQNPIRCILFFGDSFTFGTGVSDEESMPYRVGVKSAPMLKAFNLGVMGYGAHQMLAALERDVIQKMVDCDRQLVTQVIYQAIGHHIPRVAGLVRWDPHGPRYELDNSGAVIYRGRFDDGLLKLWRSIAIQALKSEIFRSFMGIPEHQIGASNADDLTLYIAIVARARDLIRSRFPCATFHVLFWDGSAKESEVILERLSALGINVHRMSAILPDYKGAADGLTYRIHPQDGHPNALAHELIATFVVQQILPDEPGCDRSIISREAGPGRRPPTAP